MPHLVVESEDGVAVLRIERPPANALDPGLVDEAVTVTGKLLRDRPRGLVVTGREGFFSAGLDLKAVPGLDAGAQREMIANVNRMIARLYALPFPVVCAVNGHAIAGGLVIALCGDYRVGSTSGKLGLTEVRAGIPFPAVAIAVIRAELSPAAARLLVLRGGLFDPAAALELGLVDELAQPEMVVQQALKVAAELAEHPPDTYARIKQQLRGPVLAELARVVDENADPLLDSWLSPETLAAAQATLSE